MSRLKPTLALLIGLSVIMAGCFDEKNVEIPSTITIGVLPDEDPEALGFRYGPLLSYLSEELGSDIQLVIPDSYDELLELFRNGAVDIAYFGGVTFVRSYADYGSVPLVMRDVDSSFTSYFIARPDSPGTTLADFEGRAIAFGSESSTSGHLMPRFFMLEMGIDPESFFGGMRYSGAHDRTARWVRDGRADLGAVNSEIVDSMLRDGRLQPGDIRIVAETPPYANYVWAVRPGLGEAFETRLRDAFLALSPGVDRHVEILGRLGAGGFLPASFGDFDRLHGVMHRVTGFEHEAAERRRP